MFRLGGVYTITSAMFTNPRADVSIIWRWNDSMCTYSPRKVHVHSYQRVEHGAEAAAGAADGRVVIDRLGDLDEHLQVVNALLNFTLSEIHKFSHFTGNYTRVIIT